MISKLNLVTVTMFAIMICYNGVLAKEIVELTKENWKASIKTSKEIWMVEVYAEYSRKSREFTKVFAEVAEKHDGLVKFGRLNSDNTFLKVHDYNIRTVPELKIWDYGKSNKANWMHRNYHGEKTVDAISEFANKLK